MHVDFPKATFSAEEIQDLESANAQGKFVLKHTKTGKALHWATVPLWPKHDVSEL